MKPPRLDWSRVNLYHFQAPALVFPGRTWSVARDENSHNWYAHLDNARIVRERYGNTSPMPFVSLHEAKSFCQDWEDKEYVKQHKEGGDQP